MPFGTGAALASVRGNHPVSARPSIYAMALAIALQLAESSQIAQGLTDPEWRHHRAQRHRPEQRYGHILALIRAEHLVLQRGLQRPGPNG